jgi:hypothetical protein
MKIATFDLSLLVCECVCTRNGLIGSSPSFYAAARAVKKENHHPVCLYLLAAQFF